MHQKRVVIYLAVIFTVVLGVGVWLLLRANPSLNAASSGIEGTVTYGPLCPTEPCPVGSAQPDYNFYVVASRADGTKVAQVYPDQSGNYRLRVAPGTYRVTVSRTFASSFDGPPPTVTVRPGQFTHLDLSYDTGIR